MFLFFLYRFFIAPISVFMIYIFGGLFSPKIRQILKQRKSQNWVYEKNPGQKINAPFWIHAASGEIEYARPLIRELKKKFPDIQIVVTYSSPSAERILKNMAEVDAWGLTPWDLFWSCRKFIDKINPRCVLFARTDVWPEITTQIHNRKIPCALFSATFAGNSSRLRGLTKHLTAYSLSRLTKIFVAEQEDLNVLIQSGLKIPAEVTGDTRYDQVFYRLQNPQKIYEHLRPAANEKILVAGSTWPEDETVLLSWYAKHSHEVRLILAPHEISKTRLEKIRNELQKRNIECDFYSKASAWKSPVLVLDQIGILAELYTWGSWAFVGGSFRKQVHSVMEPLAAGLPVWVGPFHHNNREALTFTKYTQPVPFVFASPSEQGFENAWETQLKNLPTDTHTTIQKELGLRQGATQKLITWLSCLPKTSQ